MGGCGAVASSWVLLVLVAGFEVSSVEGALINIWVAASGPNGNGTRPNPFTDLAAAFAAAAQAMDNDDVVLQFNPGHYIVQDTGLSYSSSNYVLDRTFAAVGINPLSVSPPLVTLECQGRSVDAFLISKADFGRVTIQDLLFVNCGRAVAVTADGVTISNIEVLNSNGVAIDLHSNDASITNSLFEDNEREAIAIAGGGDALVQECRFINNGANYFYAAIDVNNGNVLSVVDCFLEGNGLSESNVRVVYVNDTIVQHSPGVGFHALDSTEIYVTRSQFVFDVNGIWADRYEVPVREERGALAAAHFYLSNDTIVWQNQQQGGQDIVCTNGGAVFLYPVLANLCGGCPEGSNLDRCFVCGGDDSCLGCDGLPNSGATNCTPVPLPFLASSSPVGVNGQAGTLVSIHPTQMTAILSPASLTGQPIVPRYDLAIYLVSVTEKRPDGSVYQRYDFTSWPFFLTSTGLVQIQGHDATQTIYDYYFSIGSTHILVSWFYFPDEANLTDHGVPFTLAPQNLKITLQIDDWAWENGNLTTNSLEVVVRTENAEPITGELDVVQLLQGNFSLIQRFVDTQHTQATFSFLNFAFFERPEGQQLEIVQLAELSNLSDTRNTYFAVTFPGFFSSVHYDPDFSVALTGNPNGDNTGDGDDNLGVIIGLSVGLPLAGLIVLAVLIAGTAVLIFQRKRLVRRMTAGTGADL